MRYQPIPSDFVDDSNTSRLDRVVSSNQPVSTLNMVGTRPKTCDTDNTNKSRPKLCVTRHDFDDVTFNREEPVSTSGLASTPAETSVSDDFVEESRATLNTIPDHYTTDVADMEVDEFFADAATRDMPSPASEPLTSSPATESSSVSTTAMVPCLYNGCRKSVVPLRRFLSQHMQKAHHHPDRQEGNIICLWAGCHRTVKNNNLVRHIADRHLGLLTKICDGCLRPFSRNDALRRHQLKNCKRLK
jgi:hypothetical protein